MNQTASALPVGINAVRGAAKWLSLAAAPTFGIMALLSIVLSDERSALICSSVHGPSWLMGMIPMYLLMSAFHVGSWLRLIANRRSRARPRAAFVRGIP
ncbi:MAG TPA: hypothetical protein VGI48_00345 [Caldimonas sp.]|jgi:hypothetical protein